MRCSFSLLLWLQHTDIHISMDAFVIVDIEGRFNNSVTVELSIYKHANASFLFEVAFACHCKY